MKAERTGAGQRRALVIDDDPTILRLMRVLLEDTGLRCLGASTGEEAVELVQKERVAVIVADKNLPGISGIEVIARAKKKDPWVKSIVITGYASEDSAVEAMGLGVDAYVTKPIDIHDFRKLLFSLLPWLREEEAAKKEAVLKAADPQCARIERKLQRIGDHIRAQAEPEDVARAGAGQKHRPASVLVIHDDPSLRNDLIEAIGDRHTVAVFDSAKDAKPRVLHLGYDVLIAGKDVLQEHLDELVRSCPRPPMGCIAVVPRRGVDITAELILLGARGMILAPISKAEAASEVDTVIEMLRKERAAMATLPPTGPIRDAG